MLARVKRRTFALLSASKRRGTNLSEAKGSAKVPPEGGSVSWASEFPAFTRWANLCRAYGAESGRTPRRYI